MSTVPGDTLSQDSAQGVTDGGQDGATTGGTQDAVLSGATEGSEAQGSPAASEGEAATPAPAYADWRAVADAVESGELAGEGMKPAGSGTAEDPYSITSPEAFAWWVLLHADSHARLDVALDLTTREGEPLAWPGDSALSGELDGQGHAVAFTTSGAGLFAEVAAGGAARWLVLGRTSAELPGVWQPGTGEALRDGGPERRAGQARRVK